MAPTGTIDYGALAKQFGGAPAGAGAPPPANFDELARKFGGARVPSATPPQPVSPEVQQAISTVPRPALPRALQPTPSLPPFDLTKALVGTAADIVAPGTVMPGGIEPSPGTEIGQGASELLTPGKRATGALRTTAGVLDAAAPLAGPMAVESPGTFVRAGAESYAAGKGLKYGTKAVGGTEQQQNLAEDIGRMAPILAHAMLHPEITGGATEHGAAVQGTVGGKYGAGVEVTPDEFVIRGGSTKDPKEFRIPRRPTAPKEAGIEAPTIDASKIDDLAAKFGGKPVEEAQPEKPVHHASNDIEELRQSAEKQAPKVGDAVQAATEGVPGAKLEDVREAKDSDRIADKAERQGVQPSQVGDVLATKVTVPDQEAANQVLANLHKELPVESVEGTIAGEPQKNAVRQTQAIVNTNAPAGEPVKKAEVILQTPEMAAATDETHDDYRKAQELRAAGKETEAAEIERQIAAKHDAAEEAHALREPGSGSVLQRPQEETGARGSERGGVEPGVERKEVAAQSTQAPQPIVREPGQAPIPPSSLRKPENLKGQSVEVRDPSGAWKQGTVLADVVSGGNNGVRRLRGRFADGTEFDNIKPEEVRKAQAQTVQPAEHRADVGVDFDGTLFKENSDGSIGEPIPERIASLKQDIAAGKNVIIESHRARQPGGAAEIQKALASVGLPDLKVSAKKTEARELIDNEATKEPGVKTEKVATDANTPLPEVRAAGPTAAMRLTDGRVQSVPLRNLEKGSVGTKNELAPGKVGEIKVSDLKVAPHKFQYKLSTDAEGVGSLLKETKVFNPDLAGVISVWRDPADGQTYVVNGHHRYELAKRTNQPTVTVRHIVAPTVQAARAIGALQNIAEGRGTAIDAAKFFHDSGLTPEQLKEKGISLGEKTASDGLAMSRLDPAILAKVINGDLRQGLAVAIGEGTADPAQQAAILKQIDRMERKGQKVSDSRVREFIRLANQTEKRVEETASLFGTEQVERSLLWEKSAVSEYIQDQLRKDKKLFGFVAKGDRASELERGGNKIDVEKSKEISTGAAQAEEVYNKLSSRGGPIASILDEAARKLADGESPATTKSDAYTRVRAEISQTLGGGEGSGTGRPEGTPETSETNLTKVPASQLAAGDTFVDETGEPRRVIAVEGDKIRTADGTLKTYTGEITKLGPMNSRRALLAQGGTFHPVGLTDDELEEWSKAKGFRVEPAGEQLGMFGDNEPVMRVFRAGPKGKEQKALVYQSQLDDLAKPKPEPTEPFTLTGGETREEQPALFGAGDLGEIIGAGNGKNGGIKLPSKEEKAPSLLSGEAGSFIPSKLSPAHVRQQYDKAVEELISGKLKIGDKYHTVAKDDETIANTLHLVDNAPRYFKAKADANLKKVITGLNDDQVRLASMMADSDSRDYLHDQKPDEYKQAMQDPKVQQAIGNFQPLQEELAKDRIALGWPVRKSLHVEENAGAAAGENRWMVVDRKGAPVADFKAETQAMRYAEENGEIEPHLKRTYPEHSKSPLPAETGAGDFTGSYVHDKGLRPPRIDKKSREMSAAYHYEHGRKDFSGYLESFKQVKTALMKQQLFDDFTSKAEAWTAGTAQPPKIEYEGKTFYRPDIAAKAKEGRETLPAYAVYDPTRGEKFLMMNPDPEHGWATLATGKKGIKASDRFLGPKSVVDAMENYDSSRGGEAGTLRKWFQTQIVGLFGPVVHINNIVRRIGQATGLGTFDPRSWPSIARVIASPDLRARVLKGVDDATIDMLTRQGAYTDWGDIGSANQYIGGNLNPSNWIRAFGKGVLFDPKFAKGWGGLDPKARVIVADYFKDHFPQMTDAEVAKAVEDGFGNYNRANWTERQRLLAKFTLFPGWDTASAKWFLRHPFRVGVAGALVVLAINQALRALGKNKEEDSNDLAYIHTADRKFSSGLISDNMGNHLMAPVLGALQAKLNHEDVSAGAMVGAVRGLSALAGTISGPAIEMVADQIFNRKYAGSAGELVTPEDKYEPGTWAPNRELEKRIAFAALKGTPALNRFIDNQGHWDWAQGIGGGVLGVTNYKYGAEERFKGNVAKAATYGQTLSQLAEKNPDAAADFVKDPTKATYLLFHDDLESMARDLKEIDAQIERVRGADIPHSDRQQTLEDLKDNRNELLKAADGLNDALEEAKQGARKSAADYWRSAVTPSGSSTQLRPASAP